VKLHSPQFERALKRARKSAIKRSPELKREARRASRGFRKHYSGSMIGRALFAGLLGFYAWTIVSSRGNAAAGLALVTIWMLSWSFSRAQSLISLLYQSGDLSALSFLPIEKPVLFRWELQKYFWASVMSLLDLIAGYGTIAVYLNSPAAMAATIPAAVLAWFTMHALVLFCASRWPRFPYGAIPALAIFSLIGLGFAHLGEHLADALHTFGIPINVLLPTGWTASVFLLFTGDHDWTLALLLIPIAGVLSTIPNSLARLRAQYDFKEATRPEVSDIIPQEIEETDIATSPSDERPLRVESEAVEKIVRQNLLPPPAPWHAPAWPEKLLWRWLTPRERILAEFVFPQKIAILKGWIKSFRNAGIAVLLALAVGLRSPGWEALILIVGLVVTGFGTLLKLLGSGAAFETVNSSGTNMPRYACYGIGMRELSRLLLKYTAIQIPLLLLLTLLCGGLIAHFSSSPIGVGLLLALKVTGLVAALRFISLTLSFSSCTNDSSRFRLKNIALVIILLTAIGTFLVLAAAAIFVPDPTAAWIMWAIALPNAALVPKIYAWFYNRNWFDLMAVPRR